MFVFKAAVVGAGTMGGQIAQTIASAGIPVVLKDVEQRARRRRPREGRKVTAGPARQARQEGQAHRRSRPTPQVERDRRPHHGTTEYEGFGDVDFVIEAVPERMEIKQAGVRRARRGHARPRDPRLQHLVAVDHRDRRGDAAARQGRRLPLLLPGLGHAPDRGHRGRRHLRRDDAGRGQLRPDDPQDADHAAPRCPGFVVNRILNSAIERDLARRRRSSGLLDQEDRRGRRRGQGRADGAVLPRRPARPRHGPARRRAPATSPTATASTSTAACRSWSAEGKLGAKTGGEGFYDARRAATSGRRTTRRAGARRALHPEGVRRVVPRARGGRRRRTATSTSG